MSADVNLFKKMALFAGVFDEHITLTIAQESCGDGAAAWRVSDVYKRQNLISDAAYEERATMFGRSLNRDNRTDKEMLDEFISTDLHGGPFFVSERHKLSVLPPNQFYRTQPDSPHILSLIHIVKSFWNAVC